MEHEFVNGLTYAITVRCLSTIIRKQLITFDLKSGETYIWNQNEGTSFLMTVTKTQNNDELIDETNVKSEGRIKFIEVAKEVVAIFG